MPVKVVVEVGLALKPADEIRWHDLLEISLLGSREDLAGVVHG